MQNSEKKTNHIFIHRVSIFVFIFLLGLGRSIIFTVFFLNPVSYFELPRLLGIVNTLLAPALCRYAVTPRTRWRMLISVKDCDLCRLLSTHCRLLVPDLCSNALSCGSEQGRITNLLMTVKQYSNELLVQFSFFLLN